ncbi:MAG TPA: N-6 DNA methylase [Candidatus Limnocylindrales bacterium]|nr:N-6 DNA methylase [Candidatus Limnocylindrales bacterium]
MQTGFDEAFRRVKQLVTDFRANEKFYLSPQYQEQEARRDFIDKFWLALGWDVNHETQKNPFEQEVKVERKEHGFSQRRADYAFYLAPNFRDVKFYVEAKKPHGDIATADNYFQTARYGWSSSTPVAVLHDFEQFEILDCRYRPHIETALGQNLRKYHFSQYEDSEKFAEIYWLFSREAVANGSLERFAATLPKKRGRGVQRGLIGSADQTIDDAFLEELDQFRDELARAFKNGNPKLDGDTLTELTQRTLDRLVFLRFLEDKHIEPQNRIAYFGDKGSAWQDFIAESRRLDSIYNGIVYKKHEILDAPGFKLDDEAFSAVCERLSHLNSPYDFNAIPIHILGSIYERFLGKVIVTTDKRARLEEKPEVRKAGGVYYTPEYIVRYIVENTVGKLIAGKSPGQIAEMRFADIACGSGSFLLGVYDLLIRHHTKFYNDHPGKAKKGDVVERDDGLHLSLQKKREILLANIYGVDIDPQAVEVAQLSLYLKLLQDETPGSARNYQLEFHETLLPTLNKNIVCGNSLIGTDILTGQLFASDEEKKLNPMDFEQRFPHIFSRGRGNESLRETATPLDFTFPGVPLHGAFSYKKKSAKVARPTIPEAEGGFDAIVGNPPWGADFSDPALKYLRDHYQRVILRMIDSYIYFIDRAIRAVKPGGAVGFIIPSTLLNQTDAKPVRELLLSCGLTHLVSLGQGIFGTKVLNTSTIFVTGDGSRKGFVVGNLSEVEAEKRPQALLALPQKKWPEWKDAVVADPHRTFFINTQGTTSILTRLRAAHSPLLDSVNGSIQRGVSPDVVSAHVISFTEAKKRKLEKDALRLGLSGPQIKRYGAWKPDQFIIYTGRDTPIRKYPNALQFLDEHRHLNTCREVKEGKHPWWALHRPRDPQIFQSPKFIGLTTTKTIEVIYDEKDNLFVTDAMYVFTPKPGLCPWAFMAVMQSALFLFLYRLANQGESRVIPQIKASKLDTIPFPSLQADDLKVKRLAELCRAMLAARKQLAGAQSDKDKDFYTNRCDGLDRQIDALVYDLYALTPDEIKIVEGAYAK